MSYVISLTALCCSIYVICMCSFLFIPAELHQNQSEQQEIIQLRASNTELSTRLTIALETSLHTEEMLSRSREEVAYLTTETGKLGTHLNHKQKIQLHLQVKQENNLLKQENQDFRLEIQKLHRQIKAIQQQQHSVSHTHSLSYLIKDASSVEKEVNAERAKRPSVQQSVHTHPSDVGQENACVVDGDKMEQSVSSAKGKNDTDGANQQPIVKRVLANRQI